MSLLIRFLICLLFIGLTLYKSIDQLNELTKLRLTIPVVAKQLNEAREKNIELSYQIEQFENPLHLMELSRKPEFGHLKYPSSDQVIVIEENHE